MFWMEKSIVSVLVQSLLARELCIIMNVWAPTAFPGPMIVGSALLLLLLAGYPAMDAGCPAFASSSVWGCPIGAWSVYVVSLL